MTAETDLAVRASGLVKTFGKTRVVDGLDLTVPLGSVYGILGPNGAGKTTTVRMLATLLRPDAGTALVFGHDVVREADAVRARLALTGQFASVDEDLSGHENLMLLGRLLGHSGARARSRTADLLEAFGLTEAAHRQVKTYSGGMRRRLDIAATIFATPDLMFLDEPTTGLDPTSRSQVWQLIRTVAASGATVLLTTQYLDEADRLADRIAVMDAGRMVAEGTSGDLKASAGSGRLEVRLTDPGRRTEAQRILAALLGVPVHLGRDPSSLLAGIHDRGGGPETGRRAASAIADLVEAGIPVSQFSLAQPTLDEVFLSLTQEAARARVPEEDDR